MYYKTLPKCFFCGDKLFLELSVTFFPQLSANLRIFSANLRTVPQNGGLFRRFSENVHQVGGLFVIEFSQKGSSMTFRKFAEFHANKHFSVLTPHSPHSYNKLLYRSK